MDDAISHELVQSTIESIEVHGAFKACDVVNKALKDRLKA